MMKDISREIRFALIGALLGFFFIYLPIMKFMNWVDKMERNFREKPLVIYFKEVH